MYQDEAIALLWYLPSIILWSLPIGRLEAPRKSLKIIGAFADFTVSENQLTEYFQNSLNPICSPLSWINDYFLPKSLKLICVFRCISALLHYLHHVVFCYISCILFSNRFMLLRYILLSNISYYYPWITRPVMDRQMEGNTGCAPLVGVIIKTRTTES